jgi:hypothetical protein
MKSIIALLVVICALSIDAKVIKAPKDSKALNDAIARAITQHMAQKMRSPVLPEFEDPLPVENAELDLTELELDGLTGFVALRDGEIVGLSTVLDDLAIALTIPARITYTLTAGRLTVAGQYEANVNLNGTYFVGAGRLDAEVVNPDFEIIVRIVVNLITNRFTVSSVDIPKVTFQSVQGVAEGLTYDGELVDWDAVNEDAKPVFDAFWADNRSAIEAAVKSLLAELLKDCKITDLIAGNYDCIALPESSRRSRSRLITEILNYLA